jgi:hypothetical protein
MNYRMPDSRRRNENGKDEWSPASIELEAKRLSESRQCSFCGVGFCDLERDVPRRRGLRGAMALLDDGCAVRMHGDPDPGDVDR